MCLVKSSNTEFSDADEVPQSRGKIFFEKPSCCVFARKLMSIDLELPPPPQRRPRPAFPFAANRPYFSWQWPWPAYVLLPGRSCSQPSLWITYVMVLKQNAKLVSQNKKFSADELTNLKRHMPSPNISCNHLTRNGCQTRPFILAVTVSPVLVKCKTAVGLHRWHGATTKLARGIMVMFLHTQASLSVGSGLWPKKTHVDRTFYLKDVGIAIVRKMTTVLRSGVQSCRHLLLKHWNLLSVKICGQIL